MFFKFALRIARHFVLAILILFYIFLCCPFSVSAEILPLEYKGNGSFSFGASSDISESNFLDSLKTAMPGRPVSQDILVHNTMQTDGYANIYLQAVVYDEYGNPIISDIANTDASKKAEALLSPFSISVTIDDTIVQDHCPLTQKISLGKIQSKKSQYMTLTISSVDFVSLSQIQTLQDVHWVFSADEVYDGNHMTVTQNIISTPANGVAYCVGEEIEYQNTVINDGSSTLVELVLKDELSGDVSRVSALDPTEQYTMESKYTVQEQDQKLDNIKNIFSAEATHVANEDEKLSAMVSSEAHLLKNTPVPVPSIGPKTLTPSVDEQIHPADTGVIPDASAAPFSKKTIAVALIIAVCICVIYQIYFHIAESR